MKEKMIAVRLSEQQFNQLAELEQMGFGNQSDIIRTALDRMYQGERELLTLIAKREEAYYNLGHTPFSDSLLNVEDRIRKIFIKLARLRARQGVNGWVDIVSGELIDGTPERYYRYRYAKIDESGAENFLKKNDFFEPIK